MLEDFEALLETKRGEAATQVTLPSRIVRMLTITLFIISNPKEDKKMERY